MTKTLATFDTVSLSQSLLNFNYDKKTYENFIKDKKAFRKITNHLENDNIIKTYILKECEKHRILGLEEFILFYTSHTQTNTNSIDIKIKFNAKTLKLNYLDNINKNNYNYIANYLISELFNYVYITYDIFYKLYVRTVDYTKNLICDKYSQLDYVNTLSKVLTKTRSLKKIKTDYLDCCTIYLKLSNKSQIKMYNKNDDLIAIKEAKKNDNFIDYATELVAINKDKQLFRIEHTLNKAKDIKKYFDYKLDDNDNILFTSLLDNTKNVIYNKYNDIINKKDILKLKMIDNTLDISKINNKKDFDNSLLSQSLYLNFNDDFDKLKKYVYTNFNVNRQRQYKIYKEYEKLLKQYISQTQSEKNFILSDCYNDFENKLVNIDKYCV